MSRMWSRRSFLGATVGVASLALAAACGSKQAETEGIQTLAKGQGAVLEIDGTQVAVYKDPNGQIVKLSPLCPHAGCSVQWNAANSTWDCPCHRSVFAPDGTRISGPASEGLKKLS